MSHGALDKYVRPGLMARADVVLSIARRDKENARIAAAIKGARRQKFKKRRASR